MAARRRPPAGTALSPSAPELTARLLAPCLATGSMSDMHGHVPQDAADTILCEWGPHPEERSRYACSPHRIEMTARLIRDGYIPGYANAALRLLPEWTQWCIEQSGLTGDLAARSRAAALTEAVAFVDEKTNAPAAPRDEAPFRRQE